MGSGEGDKMSEKRVASIFDLVRMCKSFIKSGCKGCPFDGRGDVHCPVFDFTEKDNDLILAWCDTHPQKTYLQDFFEKFPNAKRSPIDPNRPMICRYSLYRCVSNEYNYCREMYCTSCWNEVMPEATK